MVGETTVSCPCRRVKCPRHGECEACRAHHANEKNSLVACERLAEKRRRREERTTKRSTRK